MICKKICAILKYLQVIMTQQSSLFHPQLRYSSPGTPRGMKWNVGLKLGNKMKIRRKKGFFSISAVAKMFSVHQQTVRLYEKQGLISPKRSEGNPRLFSDEDIDRLEEIIYLTHELGINLAGVEVIFKLKKQIKKMQNDMNKLFEKAQQNLDEQ